MKLKFPFLKSIWNPPQHIHGCLYPPDSTINYKNPLLIAVLLLVFMVAMSLVAQQESVAQPDGYVTKIVREPDTLSVYSGGSIAVKTGGAVSFEAGGSADVVSGATMTCATDTFNLQGFTPMVTQYSAVTSASSATAAVSGLDADDYLVASLNTYVTNGAVLAAALPSVNCATLVFSTTPSAIVNVTIQAWKD